MVKTVAEKVEKKAAAQPAAAQTSTPKTGKYHAAVGRRKTSTAVVKLFKGAGQFSVRKDEGFVSLQQYFGGALHMYENSLYPFTVLGNDTLKKFDAEIVVT